MGHINRRCGTHQPKAQWDTSAELAKEWSADGRIRTGDPLFTKQLLCQLSYVGVRTDYMSGWVPQTKGVLLTKWRRSCAPAQEDLPSPGLRERCRSGRW